MTRELMLCALSTALINQRGAGCLFILPRSLRGEFEGVVAFLLLHLEGGEKALELSHLSQVPALTLGDLGQVSVKYFDTGEEVVSFSCAFHTMAPELRPSKATVEVRPGEDTPLDPRIGAVVRKCTTPLRVRRAEELQES